LTKQTANLNLSKPEMADKIIDTITQLANNFDTIDASLAEKAKKLNYLSVTDYGAKLDGSDDTQALLDTIFNARVKNIRTILIPGSMTIASPNKIELTNGNFKFFGHHYNLSKITFTSANGGFLIQPDSNQTEAFEVHFEKLQISGNRVCNTLVETHHGANMYFRNCRFGATNDFLLAFYDTTIVYISDCIIDGNMVPDGQTTWSRRQKGIRLHNTFDVNLFNNLFWTMDTVFDITGYFLLVGIA
jgi:hypothetical protein